MDKKHLYYVDAVVIVPVTLKIIASSEDEARDRTTEGAWHGVISTDFDHAMIQEVKTIKLGPKIS